MDSKMLSIRSFEKNQTLLGLINKIIINRRLKSLGETSTSTQEEMVQAEAEIIQFLKALGNLIGADFKGTKILTGMDIRDRAFVRNFMDAKRKSQKYKSILFKESPIKVAEILESNDPEKDSEVIKALTDLRNIIEEHLSSDVKGLVGDF